MARKSYGVPAKSAIRALLILEYFEQVQAPLSLKAIAEHFNLAASSASALLKNLASLDYLSYDVENRTYLPTLRLSHLGGWVEKRILEDGVADLVRRLQEKTQEAIVITTLNDLYVDFMYFQHDKYYDDIYPGSRDIKYPRGGVAITCPFAWYLIKDYSYSRLENIYYRSKVKGLFDPKFLPFEEFVAQVECSRQSKFILAKPWPFPDSAILATIVPLLPFGRRVALGIGASIERMQEKLPDLLDAVAAELAGLRPPVEGGIESEAELPYRVSHIDLKFPLFASADNVPDYLPADRTIVS